MRADLFSIITMQNSHFSKFDFVFWVNSVSRVRTLWQYGAYCMGLIADFGGALTNQYCDVLHLWIKPV